MKTKYILYLISAIIGLLLLTSCKTTTKKIQTQTVTEEKIPVTCEELSRNFDDKIDSITKPICDKWAAEKNPIWIGGTLIDVSKTYVESYNRSEHRLTFQGFEKQGVITIHTAEADAIPYGVGQFYKFDLGNTCRLFFSAASSGAFYDPDLNALEPLECS